MFRILSVNKIMGRQMEDLRIPSSRVILELEDGGEINVKVYR